MLPNHPTLDYSDLPQGSRLEVSRDESGLTITSPPAGMWRQLGAFLLAWALTGAIFLALIYGGFWYFAPRAMPRPSPAVALRTIFGSVFRDAEMLIPLFIVFVIAWGAGRLSVTFIASADRLICVTAVSLWQGRRYQRRREIPLSELRDLRVARFGANVVLRTHRLKPRSAAYVIAGGRPDARWIVRALRRELNLPTD